MTRPRSLNYLVWRFCERMGMTLQDWQSLPYQEQLTCLAYERLRQREDQQRY